MGNGQDKLMVVSVGTGTSEVKYTAEEVRQLGKKNAIFWGSTVPDMFIRDASEYNEMLLQSLSESPTARKIDSEVRTLAGDHLAGTPRLHYLRYNALLTDEDIRGERKAHRTRSQAISKGQDRCRYDENGRWKSCVPPRRNWQTGRLQIAGCRFSSTRTFRAVLISDWFP
jgi:hypothetical protein